MPVRVQPPPGAREGACASQPPAPIVPSEEGDFWHATVTQLVAAEAITALARELALQSQLVARDVDQWLLRVERESLNQPASREKLQAALARAGPWREASRSRSAPWSTARRAATSSAADERQRVAEEAIRNDPDGAGDDARLGRENRSGYAQARLSFFHSFIQRSTGPTMFNKGQLAGLMKQAQAMQDNLKKAQEELATIEVEGESGAGLVKVVMTCKHDVKRITIDPSLLADDKDMLEDLVAAAFNAAVRKAEETSEQKMGKLTAGMPGLPPGMKLPVLSAQAEWPIPARSTRWSRRCAACRAWASSRPRAWPFTCCSTTARARSCWRARCSRRPTNVRHCERCNTFTEAPICSVCLDARRDASKLCVVETPADQAALERTGAFRGYYFVLMGKLSPLDGIGPKDIGLAQAVRARARRHGERGDPGHQLHRRGRGHGARDRRGAAGSAASRSRGWRAACRPAASSNTSIWAPSRTRWSTGADRQSKDDACRCRR